MSLFQQSTMECGGDYKSKISLSCHKLSLLLGYVSKAIRKVKEVRSVKWLTILWHTGSYAVGTGLCTMGQPNFDCFSFEGHTEQECRSTGKQPTSGFPQQVQNSHRY